MNHQGQRMRQILLDHEGAGPEYALVECIGEGFTCTATERVESSAPLTDEQIVTELAKRGWSVNPTLCPNHRQEEGSHR